LILKRLLFAPALLAASVLVACGSTEETELSQVFIAPPWSADEVNTYTLNRTEDGEAYGECTLELRLEAEDGNTRLSRLCSDGENRDDGTVLVDPETLRPITSNRTQYRSEKDQRLSFSSFYEPPIVKFVADENGNPRETERELPQPDETSPMPGYYDDESLLWLVRGIDLSEGYEASYQNVSAGTGQTFRVDLVVEGQEQVSVPAGEFTAWRVRVRTAAVTQFAWIEVDQPHRLVRARIKGIQDVSYELVKSE
jgi:hypothetical protein